MRYESETVRDAISRRAMDSMVALLTKANDRQIDRKCAYAGLEVLYDCVFPFLTPSIKSTFENVMSEWQAMIKADDAEEAARNAIENNAKPMQQGDDSW